MKNTTLPTQCRLCDGTKKEGKTTFSVNLGDGVVVVRNVPATVCSLCGNEWISDDIASQLEAVVDDARKKYRLVEVTQL